MTINSKLQISSQEIASLSVKTTVEARVVICAYFAMFETSFSQ